MSRLILSQITIKKERSISSTTWYYLLQPSNASAPDSTNYGNPPPTYTDTGYSGWSTTEPTYTVGDDRVLYIMVQTLYSDNTFSYATPTISSSYEAAKDTYNEIIQAEQDISELQNLGLAHGYVWDNMTAVPATSTIPVYPVGTYIASGILVSGSRTITRNNSNTYGLNTWISAGGINLRYNAIDLMKLTTSNLEFYYPSTSSQQNKAISLGTNGAVNSLIFYGFNNSYKIMELTNSELAFYSPTDGTTKEASLTSNGLVLSKGGIKAGTSRTNNFIYLSSESFADTITGHTAGTVALDDYTNTDWRQLIGTKFGVRADGTLYASSAHVEGAITATSLTIGSGLDSYDAINAINAAGYTIEIINDITAAPNNVVINDNSTYLYPIMYHNGVKVESTDITNTQYIWYRGSDIIGIQGDSSNGGIVADYGYTYRVAYSFDDGEIGQAPSVQQVLVDPSKYITRISDAGITIHPEDFSESDLTKKNYIQVDGTGLEIFSQGVSKAKYGITSRIGKPYVSGANDNESHLELDYHSLQMIDKEGMQYFDVRDLRDTSGLAQIEATFIGDGSTLSFNLSPGADNDTYTVVVSDSSGGNVTLTTGSIRFTSPPSDGAVITVTYTTTHFTAKAFTFGTRLLGYGKGATSATIGIGNIAQGRCSFSCGEENQSIGTYSFTEGIQNQALRYASHAEGYHNIAEGMYSHAEGYYTKALSSESHAEGSRTEANGTTTHAEGGSTIAKGMYSHAEGYQAISEGMYSHAEGYQTRTTNAGHYSHVQNIGTVSAQSYQTVIGKYNTALRTGSGTEADPYAYYNTGNYSFIIGNGSGDETANRSNALTADWDGNLWIAGTLTQSSDRRLKKHKSYLSNDAIEFIRELKPAYFIKDEQFHVGFYAQDVEEIDSWGCMVSEMNGYKALGYTELIAPLVTYCQYLEKCIIKLESQLEGGID